MTVRVSMDEDTIVFVIKQLDSVPDVYTPEYFQFVGLFPEKYVFESNDTVPEKYMGGGSRTKHRRRAHTSPLTPWYHRSFFVPYESFVYFVENNPLKLAISRMFAQRVQGTEQGAEQGTKGAEQGTKGAEQGTAGTEQGTEQGTNIEITPPKEVDIEQTHLDDVSNEKTIVLVFRRNLLVENPEEEGKSLPEIIVDLSKGSKGRIDTNLQGLTYPDLEQLFRLQQFLQHTILQSNVYRVNGRWIAMVEPESDTADETRNDLYELDTSTLQHTWVGKLTKGKLSKHKLT